MEILKNELLSDHTSIKIGGPASFFTVVDSAGELKSAYLWAKEKNLPYFILGGGTNTIFTDAGFSGLVIKQSGGKIDNTLEKGDFPIHPIITRFDESKVSFAPSYNDNFADRLLTVESGCSLADLIKHSLTRGLIGLEWFVGIPGTVGAAVVGNIHGGPKFFGSRIQSVTVFDENSEKKLCWDELAFDYDMSIFKTKKMPILSIEIALYSTNHNAINLAKSFARTWVVYKSAKYPSSPNCGSIFKNVTVEEAKKFNLEKSSAGWLIDQAGLKGERIGDIMVAQENANFIVNVGNGSCADFEKMVELVQKRVKETFGVTLEPEINIIPNE